VGGDGEAAAHRHARGVRLDGGVEEFLDTRKGHDVVEARGNLLLRQSEQQAGDLDVFPARDLGVKAGSELQKRGQPAPDRNRAARGPDDAGEQLQQRRLLSRSSR
jgi:hypothetical protein